MSRILIIEDNLGLATGLKNNLEVEGHRVELAPDAASGLERARGLDPQLIILDIMLPDESGYRVLRELREAGNLTPVLILTALAEEGEKVRGLRVGADDYVTKPFGLLELLARVEALLRRAQRVGGGESPARSVRFGDIAIDAGTHTVTRAAVAVPLRPREYDLLAALAFREGRVASRLELLKEVWGYQDDVSSRTVDTHIAELRRKLEADPANPRHILTVRKSGYRLALDP